nr:acyltransferase family protein [Mycobacterium sp. ACS4331]
MGLGIALVIGYDVFSERVSGGVDVLLVVLGFVFGTRMLRHLDAPGLLAELSWLARRLVPPLVVLLTVCTVLTVVVQPQTRWEAFADQTLASLAFYQNFQLVTSAADYLQASEAVTPLQHLWVVSVLGQFFLFLLVLAALVIVLTRAGRARRTVFVAVAAVAMVASFGYATAMQSSNQLLAHYSSVSRAWELLAGVLTAAIVTRVHWPSWLRTLSAAAGLVAILLCGPLIEGTLEFPGVWALVPVLATVLVILSGAQTETPTWPTRILAAAPLVAAGTLAYGLYLWHWPLLIFWLAHINDDRVGLPDGALVVVAAVIAAAATWRLIETPWRVPQHPGLQRAVAIPTIAVMVVLLTLASFAWRGHVAAARATGAELSTLPLRDYPGGLALIEHRKVPKLPMRPTALEASDDVPPATVDECLADFAGEDVVTCVYGDPKAERTIALAGGSHSEHWLTALHLLGRQHGFKVVTYLKMGCPLTTKEVPVLAGAFNPYPACRTWSDNALARIIADRPDYVFFTSTRPILNGPGDYVPDYYLGIWDELSDNGIPILGMRDTPWMVRDGMFFSPVDCLSAGGDAQSCGLARHEALAPRNPTLKHLPNYPTMTALDLSDAVCRPDVCRAVEGNVLVYHDAHHLSATYVRTLADELGRQLAEATSWW